MKFFIFYIIMLSIPVLFLLGIIEGYYGYKKVNFPTHYSGTFGVLDDELGWFHKPAAAIDHIHHAPDGTIAFQVPINTDQSGFRSKISGTPTPNSPIMFLGDSQTFGFGVTYEQSFPGQVEALLQQPVLIAASPAYGGGQAILLAQRWQSKLKPKILVYFDWGHWKRNACSGYKQPSFILKPCFWENPETRHVSIITPPPGFIEKSSKRGLWPGGMIGVGQDGWSYFLISRPILRAYGYLVRLGLASGFAHDFDAIGVDIAHMQDGVADALLALQKDSGAHLIVLDNAGMFKNKLSGLSKDKVTYIGVAQWKQDVYEFVQALPENKRTVPHDSHWSPEVNKIVAELIVKAIKEIPQ